MFFFFKQKTAYEMRISDWSSDVCSSDLLQEALDLLWAHPQVRAELQQLLAVLDAQVDHLHAPLATHPDVPLQVHGRYSRIEILAAFRSEERRVGKSVSVRVDLGGRRIIKKKKNENTIKEKTHVRHKTHKTTKL